MRGTEAVYGQDYGAYEGHKEFKMTDEKTSSYYDEATRGAAKATFKAVIKNVVASVSDRAWPENVRRRLEKLNQVLASGGTLGMGDLKPFSDEKLEEMTKYMFPLRVLEMSEECRAYLRDRLIEQGVSPADLGIVPEEDE